ncbi:hypothetical protein Ocin01_15513 [Orchesella cincta]|uniref:Uncharacterized protein n=1 Tax=Orchesella cincta TaxID=48709 RepID=A0A1D2MDY7_ORCCI|nr:hypothetical protein Ocin01_15513 [Orchesella cincta]
MKDFGNHWRIGAILFISSIYSGYCGEFRFCFEGPQRILYNDCPGGFIVKGQSPLAATCNYYYKAENVPNMLAEYNKEICGADGPFELESDYHDWTAGESFHSIRFLDVDTEGGPQIGADSNPDKCNETCFTDWIDARWNEPEEIFQDKPATIDPLVKEEYEKEYVKLTKSIMVSIIHEDEFEEDIPGNGSTTTRDDMLGSGIPDSKMTGLVKILAMSMRVLFIKCHPFIEGSFYTLVLRSMMDLRSRSEYFPNLNVVTVNRILKLLEACQKDTNEKFVLNGTECEDKFVVNTITNKINGTTKNYHGQENSFRWSLYDPIIESAWMAVDFVHGYCFDHFIQDPLHFSLYVKVMNEIFVQPITKKHWMYPVEVSKGMNVWEMAYDTADIKNQLRNMDACVVSAYMTNEFFDKRMERPFTPQENLEDPTKFKIPNPEKPTKGWSRSVNEYWRMYEQRGFKDFTENKSPAPKGHIITIKEFLEHGYKIIFPHDFTATPEEAFGRNSGRLHGQQNAEYNREICDDDGPFELDSDYHDWSTAEQFQAIRFLDVDVDGGPQIGSDPYHEKCNETCFSDWIDPRWDEPEDIFLDKPTRIDPDLQDEYEKDYVKLTRSIMVSIIQEDEFEEDAITDDGFPPERNDPLGAGIPESQMTGLAKLLAMSMRLLFIKCHPFIEGSFYTLVFHSMMELRRRSDHFPDLNMVTVNRILRLLETCQKDTNEKFMLNGTECEDKFVVHTITNKLTGRTQNFHSQENSFQWSFYDPIVEAAWMSVDFVHGYCFEHFMEDPLHYSLYVKIMNEIFVQPVTQKHWMYPVQVGKGMNAWEMAYDTSDIKSQLRNMDACVISAYMTNDFFEKRMERPFTPQENLEFPLYLPNPEEPPKGWTRSVGEYWRMYEQRGFKDFTEKYGYCFQTVEEFEEMEEDMKEECL